MIFQAKRRLWENRIETFVVELVDEKTVFVYMLEDGRKFKLNERANPHVAYEYLKKQNLTFLSVENYLHFGTSDLDSCFFICERT